MKILLDTNLLTRLTNPAQQEMHKLAEAVIETIFIRGHTPLSSSAVDL